MLTVSFERTHKVLRLEFSGVFTIDDLEAIDPVIVRVMGAEGVSRGRVRCLYDMSEIEVLAVPRSRFAARAAQVPIADLERIVVAPHRVIGDFGESYREARNLTLHAQPVIVPTREEAYSLLGLSNPRFESLD